jgi:hypothetical protein
MKTSHDYFVEFQKQLQSYYDNELISRFNAEVGNSGSGTARFSFLAAVHQEFIRRGIDYSETGGAKSISFKNKVILENGTKRIFMKCARIGNSNLRTPLFGLKRTQTYHAFCIDIKMFVPRLSCSIIFAKIS